MLQQGTLVHSTIHPMSTTPRSSSQPQWDKLKARWGCLYLVLRTMTNKLPLCSLGIPSWRYTSHLRTSKSILTYRPKRYNYIWCWFSVISLNNIFNSSPFLLCTQATLSLLHQSTVKGFIPQIEKKMHHRVWLGHKIMQSNEIDIRM